MARCWSSQRKTTSAEQGEEALGYWTTIIRHSYHCPKCEDVWYTDVKHTILSSLSKPSCKCPTCGKTGLKPVVSTEREDY